ncbi:GGDEF domain-containing protein [Pseudomonas sp. NFACC43]|uniref:GGDEF domain-containing protein n=1 Tax=unclassified Pseudomonas TaxID=196821 RepID=UPI003528395A
MFGRLGGEEFGVVLPHTSGVDALAVAEKLRVTIEAAIIQTDRGPLQITISCGVASLSLAGDSPSQLIVRADDALYSQARRPQSSTSCSCLCRAADAIPRAICRLIAGRQRSGSRPVSTGSNPLLRFVDLSQGRNVG